ncbi:MAG: hypothetical protein HY832_02745 [Candidatus Aenigmarchaeota archaeon]|nr:hypothetical protein [Candidatus Aenigmarchaeota archaeon]
MGRKVKGEVLNSVESPDGRYRLSLIKTYSGGARNHLGQRLERYVLQVQPNRESTWKDYIPFYPTDTIYSEVFRNSSDGWVVGSYPKLDITRDDRCISIKFTTTSGGILQGAKKTRNEMRYNFNGRLVAQIQKESETTTFQDIYQREAQTEVQPKNPL